MPYELFFTVALMLILSSAHNLGDIYAILSVCVVTAGSAALCECHTQI